MGAVSAHRMPVQQDVYASAALFVCGTEEPDPGISGGHAVPAGSVVLFPGRGDQLRDDHRRNLLPSGEPAGGLEPPGDETLRPSGKNAAAHRGAGQHERKLRGLGDREDRDAEDPDHCGSEP